MKTLLFLVLLLSSCGKDDSGATLEASAPSPSPTAAPKASSPSVRTLSKMELLQLVTSQAFETDELIFDLRKEKIQVDKTEQEIAAYLQSQNNIAEVYKKLPTGTIKCKYRALFTINTQYQFGNVDFFRISSEPSECKTMLLTYEVVQKCVGYTQQYYKCGIGVTYDIVLTDDMG